MPAHPEEIDDALDEGARVQYLLSPTLIRESEGGGLLLECARMKIEGVDETGRPRPVPIEGEGISFEADQIILATGEIPDLSYLPREVNLTKGLVRVNEWGQTNVGKVFAGGDMIDRPRSVSEAIGSAKQAAIAMDHYLRGDDLQEMAKGGVLHRTMRAHLGLDESSKSDSREVAALRDLNLAYSRPMRGHVPGKLPASERTDSFMEVNRGLKMDDAMDEAGRCLSCGVCKMCGNCYLFCPDGAVQLDPATGRYGINYDYCKGCGICFKECPVSTITIKTEGEE